ncbi:autotransporter outer membrane beta-barrel domain-containing protein [Salmonella enterica subsp. enterica]|nr:autotransporter outer membrane beta-barrel domain-containing protein [Salmonella enterica subsp. enterica]
MMCRYRLMMLRWRRIFRLACGAEVGLQANIDKQWSVRAQVAGQTGSNDFDDLNGSTQSAL